MEFTEDFVDLILSVVHHEFVPVAASCNGLLVEVTDDFPEVPWESEDISVLLLIENSVDTQFLIALVQVNSRLLFLLNFDLGSKATEGWGCHELSREHWESSSSSTKNGCLCVERSSYRLHILLYIIIFINVINFNFT